MQVPPIETQSQVRAQEGLALTWHAVPGAIRYGFIVGVADAPVPPLDAIMRGQSREFAVLGIPARFTGAVDIGSPVGEERQFALVAYRGDGSITPVPDVQFFPARRAPRDREYHPLLPPQLQPLARPTKPAETATSPAGTPSSAAQPDPWSALPSTSGDARAEERVAPDRTTDGPSAGAGQADAKGRVPGSGEPSAAIPRPSDASATRPSAQPDEDPWSILDRLASQAPEPVRAVRVPEPEPEEPIAALEPPTSHTAPPLPTYVDPWDISNAQALGEEEPPAPVQSFRATRPAEVAQPAAPMPDPWEELIVELQLNDDPGPDVPLAYRDPLAYLAAQEPEQHHLESEAAASDSPSPEHAADTPVAADDTPAAVAESDLDIVSSGGAISPIVDEPEPTEDLPGQGSTPGAEPDKPVMGGGQEALAVGPADDIPPVGQPDELPALAATASDVEPFSVETPAPPDVAVHVPLEAVAQKSPAVPTTEEPGAPEADERADLEQAGVVGHIPGDGLGLQDAVDMPDAARDDVAQSAAEIQPAPDVELPEMGGVFASEPDSPPTAHESESAGDEEEELASQEPAGSDHGSLIAAPRADATGADATPLTDMAEPVPPVADIEASLDIVDLSPATVTEPHDIVPDAVPTTDALVDEVLKASDSTGQVEDHGDVGALALDGIGQATRASNLADEAAPDRPLQLAGDLANEPQPELHSEPEAAEVTDSVGTSETDQVPPVTLHAGQVHLEDVRPLVPEPEGDATAPDLSVEQVSDLVAGDSLRGSMPSPDQPPPLDAQAVALPMPSRDTPETPAPIHDPGIADQFSPASAPAHSRPVPAGHTDPEVADVSGRRHDLVAEESLVDDRDSPEAALEEIAPAPHATEVPLPARGVTEPVSYDTEPEEAEVAPTVEAVADVVADAEPLQSLWIVDEESDVEAHPAPGSEQETAPEAPHVQPPVPATPEVSAILDEAELYLLPQWADYAEVERLLNQAAALAPAEPRLVALRAQLKEAQGGGADSVEALLADADRCIADSDYWGAVDAYEQALAQQPGNQAAQDGVLRARRLARWSSQLALASGDAARLQQLGDEYVDALPDLAVRAYAAAFAAQPTLGRLQPWLLALAQAGQRAIMGSTTLLAMQTLGYEAAVHNEPAVRAALSRLDAARSETRLAEVEDAITALMQALAAPGRHDLGNADSTSSG